MSRQLIELVVQDLSAKEYDTLYRRCQKSDDITELHSTGGGSVISSVISFDIDATMAPFDIARLLGISISSRKGHHRYIVNMVYTNLRNTDLVGTKTKKYITVHFSDGTELDIDYEDARDPFAKGMGTVDHADMITWVRGKVRFTEKEPGGPLTEILPVETYTVKKVAIYSSNITYISEHAMELKR